eukprot:CAMPEP_0172658298 /NCGR_PEP_ID=MMETSP1074-20121228/2698_1 /TAXON_ID=2916 /ORGANISM="Ceratium fusus, Strain PA161109" /LENGTH=480 /DNA_ID=CAMNT_0013473577 /DNA_START=119 /DNA_END=1561 /DNA_ORIENTATION=-
MAERLRKASNNCAPEKMWAMLQAALAAPNVTGALAAACDVATPRCQQAGKPQRSDSEEEEELEQVATRRRRGGVQQVEMAMKTAAPMTAPRTQQPVTQQKEARKQSPAKQRKATMRSKGSLVLKSPKAKRKLDAKDSTPRRRTGQQQSAPRKCKLETKDKVPCTPATKRELVDLGDFDDILDLVQAWVQMRSLRDTKPPRPRTQSKCGTEAANKRAKREQPGRPKTEPAVKREQLANDIVRLGRKVIHGIIDLTEEECRQQRRPRQSRQQQQQQQQQQQGALPLAASRKSSAPKRPAAIRKQAGEAFKKAAHDRPKTATVPKTMPSSSPAKAVRKAAVVSSPRNAAARAQSALKSKKGQAPLKDDTSKPRTQGTKVPRSPISPVQQIPLLATKRKWQPGSETMSMVPEQKSSQKVCGDHAKSSDAVRRLRNVASKCPPQKLWSILRAASQAPGTAGINAALEEACKVAEPRCRRIIREED